MSLTLEDWIFWAAGFVGVAVLLAALLWRSAAKVFPWFTAWCLYRLTKTTVLLFLHWKASYFAYFWTFWPSQIPETLILLGVIWNMALVLFRSHRQWKPGSTKVFKVAAGIAVSIALFLTFLGEPQTPAALLRWCIRLSLFSAILTTEFAAAVVLAALLLGGTWKQWVTGLAIGMMLWFPISFVVEMGHTYFGDERFFLDLAHLDMYAELAAIAYWIFAFSRRQPEPQALPVKLEETIERLANLRWRP